MAAEGLHHYCRHLGLSPRDPSGPRTVDLGVCNNDGGPKAAIYNPILFSEITQPIERTQKVNKDLTPSDAGQLHLFCHAECGKCGKLR